MLMLNTIKFPFLDGKNGGVPCFAHIVFFFEKEIYFRKGDNFKRDGEF